METVTLDREKTVLIESDQVDTVVSEKTQTVTVTESTTTTVAVEALGVLVHQEEVKHQVVQGGVQGPPGTPGASNQFEYVVAGQTLGGNRAVTTNLQGQLVYPDPASPNSRVYGITTHSALQGELVTVQITGTQTEPSWSWDVTKPVFVGVDGILTQVTPTTGQTLVVGYPNSPTKLFIDRQPPIYMG
jgi:hypothetical protein